MKSQKAGKAFHSIQHKVPTYTLLAVLMMAFFACGTVASEEEKKVFHYNESNGISSLDPAFARNLENMWAVNQLFDGLVELNDELEVQPLIAKSWTIDSTGKHYSFQLRSEVYFHPSIHFGTPDSTRKVTASDFKYSFLRIVDEKTASPGKWIFNQVDFEYKGGFEVVNDSTFNIHLKAPFAPFLSMLSMQYCNVVPQEVVEATGADFRSKAVGCGPFKLAFWLENVALVFHKNTSFWQRDENNEALPYLDAIKIEFVRDMSAEFMGLVKGEYDFMSGIHPAYKDELLTPNGELNKEFHERLNFQRTPFLKTDYIGILVDETASEMQGHPLLNPLVRQALNYSFDRELMVRYLRNNAVVEAGHGFIPKGLPGYVESANYGVNYDLKKAKDLLREANYPEGEGIPPITISSTSDYVDLCEYLQHAWQKIGLNVEIDVLAGSAHREKVAKSQLMMFRKSWLADYPDAENFLGLFHSKNFCPDGPNYTHFKSLEFDSLFEASSLMPLQERERAYRKLDSLVMSSSPVIPLFYDQVSHFVSKDVLDFPTNPVNMLDLKRVQKK